MNQHFTSYQQKLLYLIVISAFTSTLWLDIEIGSIHLFPHRILLILMWLLFVVTTLVTNKGRFNLSQIKVKIYFQYFVLWLSYAFLSIMWVPDHVAALKHTIFLFLGFSIIFFTVYYLRSINNLKKLYWLWILIFMTLIPIGFWEVIEGNHLIVSNLYEEARLSLKYAPTTVFFNQNDFAAYISLTLPMIFVWVRYCPKFYSRILGVLVLIAGSYLLIMTNSRSSYLAVLIGLAFWFIFLVQIKTKIKTLLILISMGMVLIFSFPQLMDDSKDPYVVVRSQVMKTIGIESDDESIERRLNLIKNALYFTVQSAGFGVGAGNAEYYIDNYQIFPTGGVSNIHNWWMEVLVNHGLFIFTGYVILYVSLIWNLWCAYKRKLEHTEKMICEALLVGLIIFIIASTSSSSVVAFHPQWIFLGFAMAFLNYVRIKATKETPNAHSDRTV